MGNVTQTSLYPNTITKLGSAIDLDSTEVRGKLGLVNGGTNSDTVSAAQIELDLQPGVDIQSFSVELSGYAALVTTGFVTRTGSGQIFTRSLSGGTGVSIQNTAGLSANPIISIGQSVAVSATPSFSGVNSTAADRKTYSLYLSATTLTYADSIAYLSGSFTLQLPPVATFDRAIFTLKNIDVGTVVLSATPVNTIDGLSALSLSAQWMTVTIQAVSALSAWAII